MPVLTDAEAERLRQQLSAPRSAEAMRVLLDHSDRFLLLSTREVADLAGCSKTVTARALGRAALLGYVERTTKPGTVPAVRAWRLTVTGREFARGLPT